MDTEWRRHQIYERREKESTVQLTPASIDLFRGLADDADNWSGTPPVEVSPEHKGNLTQLKKAGLLTTFAERHRINGLIQVLTWAEFTPAGIDYAETLGIDLGWLRNR